MMGSGCVGGGDPGGANLSLPVRLNRSHQRSPVRFVLSVTVNNLPENGTVHEEQPKRVLTSAVF